MGQNNLSASIGSFNKYHNDGWEQAIFIIKLVNFFDPNSWIWQFLTHDFPQIILVLALFGTQTSKHLYFFAKFYLKFMKRVKRGYVPCKYIVPWEKVELLLGISFSAEDHKYFPYFCHFPPFFETFFHTCKNIIIYTEITLSYMWSEYLCLFTILGKKCIVIHTINTAFQLFVYC